MHVTTQEVMQLVIVLFCYALQASETGTGCSLWSNIADMEFVNTEKYVDKLRSHLKWSYKVTHETNLKEIKRNKRIYDKDISCSKMELGGLVLVRHKNFGGNHKIQDRWENVPYVVMEKPYSCVQQEMLELDCEKNLQWNRKTLCAKGL